MATANKKELNILLLGETGAGKSTTINALANYLCFGTFEKAQTAPALIEVLSTQFTIADPNKPGDSLVIRSGPEDPFSNERHGFGNSVTQFPKGYLLDAGDYTLRLIDTPGVGDTGNIPDEDRRHFGQILAFLAHHETLSAVLFIIKGSDARMTAFFRYCITELLTHLHRDVRHNLFFVFTHSRDSDYGPGNAFAMLQQFFSTDIAEVSIKLDPLTNCFFIDNDVYLYLIASKQGRPYREAQVAGFRDSWQFSADQLHNFLERVSSTTPHLLKQTLTLNSVRTMINDLVQPLVHIEEVLKCNLKALKRMKHVIQNSEIQKSSLKDQLLFEEWELQINMLPFASTICTSKKCIQTVGDQIYFNTRCHENCKCLFVRQCETGQHMIKTCKVMKWKLSKASINCVKCGCSWREHTHFSVEYNKTRVTVTNNKVVAKIAKINDNIGHIEKHIQAIESLSEEYQEEVDIVSDASAKFACFLKANCYMTYNKYFENYLDFLIEGEKKKAQPELKPLFQIKRDHQQRVDLLNKAIDNSMDHSVKAITIEEVAKLEQRLLNLKHTGHTFQKTLDVIHAAQQQQFRYCETKVNVVLDGNEVDDGEPEPSSRVNSDKSDNASPTKNYILNQKIKFKSVFTNLSAKLLRE